jgi:putative Holliday junction resolvase
VRVVGLDLGERRIGVAVSDSGRTVATPYDTVTRSGDAEVDRRALWAVMAEVGVGHVVVGLPVSMDGRRRQAARAAEAEADALRAAWAGHGVTVETFDERLTTVSAERSLRGAGHDGRARRGRVDAAAAAVMLQAWLDGHAVRSRSATSDAGRADA